MSCLGLREDGMKRSRECIEGGRKGVRRRVSKDFRSPPSRIGKERDRKGGG